MGGTYIQGVGFRPNAISLGMSPADLRYARSHIERQTGLRLTFAQTENLWIEIGRRSILREAGDVRIGICVEMVDALCGRLLDHPWPLNGGDGNEEEGEFFHNFTSAAIAAGYEVSSRSAA